MGDKEHVQHVLLDPNHDSEKKGKFGENIRRGAAVGRPAGYWPRILQQWPRQRLGLHCTDTLVCFANNKQWDFYFFPNKM